MVCFKPWQPIKSIMTQNNLNFPPNTDRKPHISVLTLASIHILMSMLLPQTQICLAAPISPLPSLQNFPSPLVGPFSSSFPFMHFLKSQSQLYILFHSLFLCLSLFLLCFVLFISSIVILSSLLHGSRSANNDAFG